MFQLLVITFFPFHEVTLQIPRRTKLIIQQIQLENKVFKNLALTGDQNIFMFSWQQTLRSVLQLSLENYTLVQEKYLHKHNVPRSKLMSGDFSSPQQPQVCRTIWDPADTLTEARQFSQSPWVKCPQLPQQLKEKVLDMKISKLFSTSLWISWAQGYKTALLLQPTDGL